jgi:hypothetical protein
MKENGLNGWNISLAELSLKEGIENLFMEYNLLLVLHIEIEYSF